MRLPPEIGRRAWQRLHRWSDDFRAEVEASGCGCRCGEFAQKMTRFLHDLVSIHLGKRPFDEQNFVEMAQAVADTLHTWYNTNKPMFPTSERAGLLPRATEPSEQVPLFVLQQMAEQEQRHWTALKQTLRFPIHSRDQLRHISRAQDELSKAGVTFDTGANVGGQAGVTSRDWELDWSLKGATLLDHRVGMETTLPLCTPAEQVKMERCIQEMKAKEGKANPWAVCQTSLGCRRRRWQVPADSDNWVYAPGVRQRIWPWPESFDDEEDDEDDGEGTDWAKHRQAARAPVLSQSFLHSVLAAAVSGGAAAFGATLVSKVLEKRKEEEHAAGRRLVGIVDDSRKDNNKESDEGEKAGAPTRAQVPVPGVAIVEGDMIQADLGPLLSDLDKLLKDEGRMGEVDSRTLRVTRE